MIASDGLPDELPHQVRSTETLRSERAALSEGGRVAAEGSAAEPPAAVSVAVAVTAVAAISPVLGVKGESDRTKSEDGDMSDSALARAASEPPVNEDADDEEVMTSAASAGDRDKAVDDANRR